jgi:hypothetical protein
MFFAHTIFFSITVGKINLDKLTFFTLLLRLKQKVLLRNKPVEMNTQRNNPIPFGGKKKRKSDYQKHNTVTFKERMPMHIRNRRNLNRINTCILNLALNEK